MKGAANEIISYLPSVTNKIESRLGVKQDFAYNIVLIRDNNRFYNLSKNRMISAFAVPEKKFFVINCSTMKTHPLNLRLIVTHELTHLILHRHIERALLPKWLDEGISQWVSDGLNEIVGTEKSDILVKASLSGKLISFKYLERSFPSDKNGMLLSYMQSLSIVEYLEREYGIDHLKKIISLLADGTDIDAAVKRTTFTEMETLEKRWMESLNKGSKWINFIARNFSWILFTMAGLLTVYGFMRLRHRMKNYKDDDEELYDKEYDQD